MLAGAEPEELITVRVASARPRPQLAASDAIGAGITMLALVLGLAELAFLPLTRARAASESAGEAVRTIAAGAASDRRRRAELRRPA